MTYYSHEWHDNPPKVGIKFFYGVDRTQEVETQFLLSRM